MRETDPGRYGVKRSPSVELPPAGDYGHVRIKHGSVDDPNPIFRGQKQLAAINVSTDALEREYAHRRIDEASYLAGRRYQLALELQAIHPVGSCWSDARGGDPVQMRDDRIVRALETAEQAIRVLDGCRPVIGMLGERVLVLTLGYRMTLGEAAERMGGSQHWRAREACGDRFRTALAALADHWSVRGADGGGVRWRPAQK